MTTSHGGSFQNISATNAITASPKIKTMPFVSRRYDRVRNCGPARDKDIDECDRNRDRQRLKDDQD